MLPRAIREIIDELCKLPGIGPKSAERLAFFLLRSEQRSLDSLSKAVGEVRRGTILCETCFNIAESSPCRICSSENRETGTLCVVEEPLDVFALEKTGEFRGQYHVLHGALSPIDNIGPDDLKLKELLSRLRSGKIREVILATNSNAKGEATALYILQKTQELKTQNPSLSFTVTHLAQGLPLGGEIEYADFETLGRAMRGRTSY